MKGPIPFNTHLSRRFRESLGTSRQNMEDVEQYSVGVY